MGRKKAFSNGDSAAAKPPADGVELPDYSHFLPKRSKTGGHVTNDMVAKLLKRAGL